MRRQTRLALLVSVVLAAALLAARLPGLSAGAAAPSRAFIADSVALRASAEALSRMTPCPVTEIVDGDTIRCGELGRVRLLLIDTPERDQKPWGARARSALEALLAVGSEARLESDVQARDQYGRLLAYVYRSDGLQVNEMMVRNGYAVVLVYPPNVRHVDPLRTASREAQEAKRGLWSTAAFDCAPRDHRAGRCP
jgi:endonuclease YncB( thermonuclease family)